jgi:hypothetical protein
MDSSSQPVDVPAAARELTQDEVWCWLKEHNFTKACRAFELEMEPTPETLCCSAEKLPTKETSEANRSFSLRTELGSSVEEALSAYQQLAGEGSVYSLLHHWDPQLLPIYHRRVMEGGSGFERCDVERRLAELQESNSRLRTSERELNMQLKQTVTIIAERLQVLVTSVDPMRRDILLPLLRTVAVFGSSSSVRAAARHMMLTLYKRPTFEHRLAMVQEWLLIARDAPSRSLEQELIPELYSLVNAQVFERRLLALDCAAAVAPLLRRSPQVRYSLCQGLLRPLCEDDTSAVRRELPRCLSLMWGDAGLNVLDGVRGSTGDGSSPSTRGGASTTPAAVGAGADSAQALASAAAVSLSPSQQSFVMELLVHLATDTNSSTVRQAAQTQLCEVLYPVFVRDGVLLTQFVPLLLTVISMEASQLLLQRKPNARGSAGAASATATACGRASVSESRKCAADETTAAVAAVLSLNNVMTLVQLLHAALRCVAAEVVHSREAEGRQGERSAQAATPTAATAPAASIATSVANTYVRVVLPTAHASLIPLLSKTSFTSARREEVCGGGGGVGGGGCGDGVQDPSTQLCGVLCALCAALASIAPLLGASAWDGVLRFLKTSVLASPPPHTDVASVTSDAPFCVSLTAAHDPSQNLGEALRGRLLFTYSYLLFLSGDAVALPYHAEQPPSNELDATTANTNAATASSSFQRGRGGDVPDHDVRPLPLSKRIPQESLGFLAQQIRLDSDSLTSPRSAAMAACVNCIASLAPFAQESHEMSSGIVALIHFLVTSTDPRLRLTAVVLVHDACAAVTSERLRVLLLIEPLQPLLMDAQPLVQEAALTGILSVATALTEPRAQEKTIRPVLRVADMAGCTSRFTRCLLVQWDQLMQRMPAEPREALLYPQLAALMDRLAEQYVERASREGMTASPRPPPPAVAGPTYSLNDHLPHTSSTITDNEIMAHAVVAPSCQSTDSSAEQWESTMLILQGLLQSILLCAVVTPTLVSRYLLPGIRQLASKGVLSGCSSSVRTRWHHLLKSYLVFTENNTSRFASFAANPSAGNLLDRVKDELKKRL